MSEKQKSIQRTTIIIDEKILAKVRQIQAKQIVKTNKSISLSKIINELLEKATTNHLRS